MWGLTQAPSLRGGACGFARRRGKRGIAARRAGVGAPYNVGGCTLRGRCGFARRFASVPCSCAERRDGVPYLACADLPYVESNFSHVLRGPSRTPAPTVARLRMHATHFLPPAGEGGIRRSPARRMTEEGEPHRLQTVKPLLFPAAGGHFHIEVPPCSPSPVALEGDTLPRCRGRFSLTTFSHGKRKTCHPAPSPPPPPANPRVFCRRLFLANSPRIRYNIPASGRGRGCPLFVFRSSASLRARRGGAISLSHRSVISYV